MVTWLRLNHGLSKELTMKFDFDEYNYKIFCKQNNKNPGHYSTLHKFEKLCQKLGINTKPLKVVGMKNEQSF